MTKMLNVRAIFEFLALSDEALQMIRIGDLQEAMRVFGWTEAKWETPERFEYYSRQGTSRGQRPPWDELTMTEQEAATSVCWNRELWNRIPLLGVCLGSEFQKLII